MATAETAARLDADLRRLRGKEAPAVASTNPQAELLGRIFHVPTDTAATWQQMATVIGVELLAAFALAAFDMLAPGGPVPEVTKAPIAPASEPETPPVVELSTPEPGRDPAPRSGNVVAFIQPENFGNEELFMLASVTYTKGSSLSWAELYVRYCQWCAEQGLPSMPVKTFDKRLDALRDDGTIRCRARGDDVYVMDVRFVDAEPRTQKRPGSMANRRKQS